MSHFNFGTYTGTKLEKEFFIAVGQSNYDKVQEFLDMGIDVNTYSSLGKTALIEAAINGDNHLVHQLLSCEDIDTGKKSLEFGFTALHSAVRSEHYETTKILLANGADVNVETRNNTTCLHFAVTTSNKAIIKLLLYYGANINAIDTFQHTPLSLAVLDTRNYEIAKLLLEFDANPNLERVNHIPLVYEVILNTSGMFYIHFIRLLHKFGGDFSQKDNVGRTGMHYAAMTGYIVLAAYLLDLGFSLWEKDKLGLLPIDIGKRHNNIDMVRFLGKVMTNIEEVDRDIEGDAFRCRRIQSTFRPVRFIDKVSRIFPNKRK